MDKKNFGVFIKSYVKSVLDKIQSTLSAEEVEVFKKKSMEFVTFIVKKFGDCEFYLNEKSVDHPISTMGIGVWDEDCVEGPNFYYLKHALDKVKC